MSILHERVKLFRANFFVPSTLDHFENKPRWGVMFDEDDNPNRAELAWVANPRGTGCQRGSFWAMIKPHLTMVSGDYDELARRLDHCRVRNLESDWLFRGATVDIALREIKVHDKTAMVFSEIIINDITDLNLS